MELNRRDEKKYREFLKQIEGYEDKRLQVYSYIINDFIKKNYRSDDNSSYDIDDFIQEAYALLYSKQEQIEEVDNELSNLYNNMNDNVVEEKEPKMVIQIDMIEYMNSLETETEKEILKALLEDEDLDETAKRLNISKRDLKRTLIKLFTDLKRYLKTNNVTFYLEDQGIKKR